MIEQYINQSLQRIALPEGYQAHVEEQGMVPVSNMQGEQFLLGNLSTLCQQGEFETFARMIHTQLSQVPELLTLSVQEVYARLQHGVAFGAVDKQGNLVSFQSCRFWGQEKELDMEQSLEGTTLIEVGSMWTHPEHLKKGLSSALLDVSLHTLAMKFEGVPVVAVTEAHGNARHILLNKGFVPKDMAKVTEEMSQLAAPCPDTCSIKGGECGCVIYQKQ